MKGSSKYRKLQNDLDNVGIPTSILKIDKKAYSFMVNFEIVAVLKKRDSINKRLIKLHNERLQTRS
jgi:hypothetical protein